jgi:hypothetical protein
LKQCAAIRDGPSVRKVGEQVIVKYPPEAVIDVTALHPLIEFFLGLAFQGLPLFERGLAPGWNGSKNFAAVGEE